MYAAFGIRRENCKIIREKARKNTLAAEQLAENISNLHQHFISDIAPQQIVYHLERTYIQPHHGKFRQRIFIDHTAGIPHKRVTVVQTRKRVKVCNGTKLVLKTFFLCDVCDKRVHLCGAVFAAHYLASHRYPDFAAARLTPGNMLEMSARFGECEYFLANCLDIIGANSTAGIFRHFQHTFVKARITEHFNKAAVHKHCMKSSIAAEFRKRNAARSVIYNHFQTRFTFTQLSAALFLAKLLPFFGSYIKENAVVLFFIVIFGYSARHNSYIAA